MDADADALKLSVPSPTNRCIIHIIRSNNSMQASESIVKRNKYRITMFQENEWFSGRLFDFV